MTPPPMGNRLVAKRRVLLLRHGRTMWNAEHRFQGQADPPLDDVGRAQAFEVAALVGALQPVSSCRRTRCGRCRPPRRSARSPACG